MWPTIWSARACPSATRIAWPAGWSACLAGQAALCVDATLEELRALSPLFDDDYYTVVDLDRVVAGKISPGGTAPQRVDEQLALAREVLSRATA